MTFIVWRPTQAFGDKIAIKFAAIILKTNFC